MTSKNNVIRFDRDLVKRYGGRGPRYTSYPTALQFDDSTNVFVLNAAALRLQRRGSLGWLGSWSRSEDLGTRDIYIYIYIYQNHRERERERERERKREVS